MISGTSPEEGPKGPAMAIQIRDLRKSYGHVQAVKGISLDVPEGDFFAFLGVNGAGKSTTISCLTTLLRPTSGKARVAGHTLGKDDDAIRRTIGVVFQAALLDPRLSVRENLVLRARLHKIPRQRSAARIDELIGLLGMRTFMDRQYRHLSGGQKRRADIARALIHQPSILFLDEPTAGLDPYGREQVWKAITDVRNHEGMTVFLTTHYMEETERSDMVCVIDKGQIVVQGTPAQLRRQYSHSELSVRLIDEQEGMGRLLRLFPDGKLEVPLTPSEPWRLPVQSTDHVKWILPFLWDQVEDLEFRHGSMDDVFLEVTGHRGDDTDEEEATPPKPKKTPRRLKKKQTVT
ncbi:MAG: ABC transporter ATP-binding protein [Propionibacteriaceae bacterium]|nr:ABC transporter ATP-binding protein [Propionibacteriaceae bacterium]